MRNNMNGIEGNSLIFEAYKRIFNESAIISVTNDEGIISYVNDKFCEISSYTKRELIGENFSIINESLHSKELMPGLWNLLTEGELGNAEFKNLGKDGGYFWVETTIVPFVDIVSGALNYLAIHKDISEKKKTESDLTLAKQELEKIAIIKDKLLSNINHEIRTPLNAILGYSELMSKTHLNIIQKDYLKNLSTGGENLLFVINDLLDVAKIAAGLIKIEIQPFNIKTLLKNQHESAKQKAKEKLIDVNFFLDADLPDILIGDSGRLNQILSNLISNAFKFTHRGSVKVIAKIVHESKENYRLNFTIIDTGIGIPREKLNRIFESYISKETDTTRRFGGMGLGLNITRSLIELQGGSISGKSTVGIGSEFSFEITYVKVNQDAMNINERIAPKADNLNRDVNILLCEDNLLNQRLAQSVIKNFGFNIDIANNGREGVEMMKKRKYDLILMDLQMPEMDGFQATLNIRNELKSDTPIIAMTAADSLFGEREKCLQIGMNSYILKPFKQADLYAQIVMSIREKETAQLRTSAGLREHKSVQPDPLNQLKEFSNGNRDFERELIEMFLTDVPREINTLNEAVVTKDNLQIRRLAHKLKSSFNLIGAETILPQIKEIENLAKNEANLQDINEKIDEVNSKLNELYPELLNLLETEYLI